MKKRLPLLLIPVAMLIGLLGWYYWDIIGLYIAPKWVLTSVLSDTFPQLTQRFDGNPILLVLDNLDPDGKQQIDIQLSGDNSLLGYITCDAMLQTDTSGHRYAAKGSVQTSDRMLDLQIYFDDTFMAVSSDELVKGNYYGITYDTFAADLDSIPLLSLFLKDDVVEELEEAVFQIRDIALREHKIPQLPEISEKDTDLLLAGILALPSKSEKCELKMNGRLISCHRIRYSAKGSQICELLEHIMDTGNADTGSVTADFYLRENKLLMLDINASAGKNTTSLQISFDGSVRSDPITLVWSQGKNGTRSEYSFRVDTNRSGNQLQEDWEIHIYQNKNSHSILFSYDWDTKSGDMDLTLDNDLSMRLNLTRAKTGFRVQTQDITVLTDYLLGKTREGYRKPVSCEMHVIPGVSFETPQYRNLDDWSLNDFVTLMEGVGALLGISI